MLRVDLPRGQWAAVGLRNRGHGCDDILIGRSLRDVRLRRGLTLRAVAHDAGVTESFLSQVERDIASPSIATLRRIAVALGTTIGDAARQRRAAWPPGAARERRFGYAGLVAATSS